MRLPDGTEHDLGSHFAPTGVCWDAELDRIVCHLGFDSYPALSRATLVLEYGKRKHDRPIEFRQFNRCGQEVAYVEVNEFAPEELAVSEVFYVNVCSSTP